MELKFYFQNFECCFVLFEEKKIELFLIHNILCELKNLCCCLLLKEDNYFE